jgi:ferric-dicitrate binding protein FerR (iron transport regulator)
MSMSESDTSRLTQAAAWRVRLTENTVEGCLELSAWLAEDVRNAAAWKRVQDDWALFAEHASSLELLELRSAALAHAHEAGQGRWVRSRRCAIAHRLGIAAGILILTGLSLPATQPDLYDTRAGEQRVVTLSDKSQVMLDSRSEIGVYYSAHARELQFENEPLTTVVARINRYAQHAIVIGDTQTGELRISGVLHTDEVEGFVSSIAAYLQVRVERQADGTLRLTRRSRLHGVGPSPSLTAWRALRL